MIMTIHEVSAPPRSDGSALTEASAEEWLRTTLFRPGPRRRAGVELEYVVHTRPGPPRHPHPDELRPARSEAEAQFSFNRFTVEPGGQVELSNTTPAPDIATAIERTAHDLAVLREALARHGLRAVGRGTDPLPSPPRVLIEPRYAAMERYLDRWGPAGRVMMRRTASVQVNVEAATHGRSDTAERWALLHAVGPALAAAFDTSGGERQRTWLALDPARCRPPHLRRGESPPSAYARWALDAPLMVVRRPGPDWSAPPAVSFRTWVRGGVPSLPQPTLDDLAYHLTTLFPPVRARGHLEVRYLDAQPARWWRVPAAVVPALLDDDRAAAATGAAGERVASLEDPWTRAATVGLADPVLCAAARGLLEAAAESLDRAGHRDLAALTADYLSCRPVDPTPQEAEPC
ncbi:glutamate-cysteine ligase family protein [Spongisporangium articulatum]|uniref:Glutamate--cysteine ligase EgtA n=1 Tax=Spongisporangium articulatum TaxID=3362603 RepID=A0ABW8AJM4_9ACTN